MKLSGVREDYNFLREIYTVDAAERKFTGVMASYPLLLHPANPSSEYEKYENELTSRDGTEQLSFIREELLTMPKRFCYLDMRGVEMSSSADVVGDLYFVIDTDGVEDENVIIILVYSMYSDASLYKYFIALATDNGKGNGQLVYGKRQGVLYPEEAFTSTRDEIREYINEITGNAATAIMGACMLNAWAREHDQYPVVKRRVTSATLNKQMRPHKRRDLPRLIYMNKLPSTNNTVHQGGHHASPRGHERRGHYKTLRHEKYKHHPKYGVEKGIYVRPAWVGDKSVVHEGNRYTVIT
jgi:hypothetical protein